MNTKLRLAFVEEAQMQTVALVDLSWTYPGCSKQTGSPGQVLCFASPLWGGSPWSGKENKLMEMLLYICLSHKGSLMQIKTKRHAGLHLRMNENSNSRCLTGVDLLCTMGHWECNPPSQHKLVWYRRSSPAAGPWVMWFSHWEQHWAGSCLVKHMLGALSFFYS